MSPRVTSPKEGDTCIKPELNHVQSTNLWPQSQNHTADRPLSKDLDGTVPSLTESVHTETGLSSGSDSLDTGERGNHQGPHSEELL